MFSRLAVLAFATFFVQLTLALLPDGRAHGNMKLPTRRYPEPIQTPVGETLAASTSASPNLFSVNGTQLPPADTVYYFDQLIDHTNPSMGTFKQRYYFTYQYWEGGPVVLTTAGEGPIDGYDGDLFNTSMVGKIAQENKGTSIVLEHRFFGQSNPLPDLSTKSLQYLTLEQSIDDLEYFANNVALPMPGGTEQTPNKVPWIMVGGSYPGALTAWAMNRKPGLFWAGYASSAPVQPVYDFWQYFEPTRTNMPPSCASDVEAVIAHVDQVLNGTDATATAALLEQFGLTGIKHVDDAAAALRNDIWTWQELSPPPAAGDDFVDFCNTLDPGSNGQTTGSGQGLDKALTAWSTWFKNNTIPTNCGNIPASECFDTYDANYSDTTVGNSVRAWQWLVCTDFGVWRSGAPTGQATLVSRLVDPEYDLKSCALYFPEYFPSQQTEPNINGTISTYGGANMQVDRLYFANGQRDPWLYTTVSSPDTNRASTPNTPVGMGGGYHCTDMIWESGDVDPTVRLVQDAILSNMTTWLPQYKAGVYQLANPTDTPDAVPAQTGSGSSPSSTGNSKHSGALRMAPTINIGAGLVMLFMYLL